MSVFVFLLRGIIQEIAGPSILLVWRGSIPEIHGNVSVRLCETTKARSLFAAIAL
jgi:hypothetical protein